MTVDPVLVDKKTITVKYTDWGEYVYYATFIVSFGYRGAPTNDTNLRVRTIWADGQVIYFRDTAVSPIRKMPGLQWDFRRGTEDQLPFGTGSMAYRGQILLYFYRYPLGSSPSGLPAITAEFEDTDGTLTVAEVVTTLGIRAGFEPSNISVEGPLDQFDVIGYILNSQSTLESVATDLGYLYDFSMTEYAGTITFRHAYDEDGDIVIHGTIPDGKLAVLNPGAEDQQIDIIQRGSDNNLPLSLSATYYDYDLFYDPGFQSVNRNSGPLRTQNSNLSVNLSLPIVAHGDEIKSRLMAALYRTWDGKNGHSLRLPPEFMYLDAGDFAAWTSYGTNYTGQLVKVTLNADFTQSVSVNERAAVYNEVIVPTETPSAPDVIVEYFPAYGVLLDVPDTSEDQAIDGLLNLRVAVGPSASGDPFYGARLDMTTADQPTSWAPVAVINTPTLMTTLTEIPADNATEVTISIQEGFMTFDRLDAATPGDLVIFGTPGYYEIASFEGYVDNGDDTATVSLTRGLFGTDDLINTHTSGVDDFLFYADTIGINYPVSAYRDYTQYLWRTVAAFQPLSEVSNKFWVPQGNSRKPYSPNGFNVARALDGDITFTWSEDVRFSGEPDPKTYSLDVYSADGSEVLRRFQNITTTVQSYYIEEQQNDGFDGTETSVFAVVYQNNLSHVGRGFPSGGSIAIDAEGILEGNGLLQLFAEATIDQTILFEGSGVLELQASADLSNFSGGMAAHGTILMEAEANLRNAIPPEPYISSYELGSQTGPHTGSVFRLEIDKPANTEEGDLLVFASFINSVSADASWAGLAVDTLRELVGGADAGFTTLQAQKLGTATARPKAMLSWKIAGPSEPDTYMWESRATSVVTGQRRGILMRFTNFDPENPIYSNGYQASATNTRLHTAPSISAQLNDFLFNIVFPRVQLWSISAVDYTKPADMSWLFTPESPGGSQENLVVVADKYITVDGATGAKTYTPPVSVNPENTNSVPYVGFSFAVNSKPILSADAVLTLSGTGNLQDPQKLEANAVIDLNASANLQSPDALVADALLELFASATLEEPPAFEIVELAFVQESGTSFAASWDGSLVEAGDIILAYLSAATTTAPSGVPSGYNLIQGNTLTVCGQRLYAYTASGGETGATFTVPAARRSGIFVRIRGAASVSAVQAPGSGNSNNNNDFSGSFTTTAADMPMIGFWYSVMTTGNVAFNSPAHTGGNWSDSVMNIQRNEAATGGSMATGWTSGDAASGSTVGSGRTFGMDVSSAGTVRHDAAFVLITPNP